jgi:hypothetical protein
MEGSYSTGQSLQRAVVPMEEEEEYTNLPVKMFTFSKLKFSRPLCLKFLQ